MMHVDLMCTPVLAPPLGSGVWSTRKATHKYAPCFSPCLLFVSPRRVAGPSSWQRIGTEDSDEPGSLEVRSWERYVKDAGNLAKWQLSRRNDVRETAKRSTVLVDVDILCRETFFVSDDASQQVRGTVTTRPLFFIISNHSHKLLFLCYRSSTLKASNYTASAGFPLQNNPF